MDIRKGNDVNVYFELSKIGVPSAESLKGIRCFFVKDVRSESGDVPVPPSLNPSSYVIHDHMHPGYNVHMPYRSITLHVHREFCVPDNCPPGWHGQTVFVVTDYKIVNIEKDGETVPYLRVTFGGDKQRNGRYNVVLEIVYIGTDDQGSSDVKCTYDYGHQFDLTDLITALSGRADIWLTDQKDIFTKVEELEKDLVQEVSRSTTQDERVENAILGIHGSIDDLHDEIEGVENTISDIEEKIPSTASSSNLLTDKEFVNSSIATSTATFRGTVNTVEDLENITEADENDYAFVVQRKELSLIFWNWSANNPEGIKDITIEGVGATGTIPSTDAAFTINVKGATEETNVKVVYTIDIDHRPGVILSKGTQLLVPVKTVGDAIIVRGRDGASYIPIAIDGVRKYGSPVVLHTVTLTDVERGYAIIEAVEDCFFNAIIYMVYSNVAFHRYKYANSAWSYEYTLNNSSFTAAQWAAINSGITSDLVSKLGTTATTTSDGLMSSLDKIKLDDLGTIADGSEIVQSAGESTTFVGAVSRLISSLFYAICPAGKFKGLYNIDNDYQIGEYVVNPDDMKLYVFTEIHYHGEGLAPNVNCEEVHLS